MSNSFFSFLATLAPSKLTNGIDLIFASTWIPESKSVRLIKKSDYDNCIQMAQKTNKDFISYCDEQFGKPNDEPAKKQSIMDAMIRKQMASSTIYRNELKCKNDDFHMKPYKHQIWPSYGGIHGNGRANV